MIIKTDKSEFETYLADAANYKGNCSKVYFPTNKNEIIEVLKIAGSEKRKVTLAGNRTGLTGAAIPNGGIVISTEKLNRIIEINKEEKFAVLEPGVVLADFHKRINENGLYYPPDPTEQDCFIGGTVATNASGAKTFKYGATRNFVLQLKIVLSDGDTITLERGKLFAENYQLELVTDSGKIISVPIPDYKMPDTKHAAGYFAEKNMDAVDLFIGSEGTLGVIYEIKLRLIDLPERILSSVVFFKNEVDAFKFTEEARRLSYETRNKELKNQIDALSLEFFDEFALNFVSESFPNIPENSKAAIWFEQEIIETAENKVLELWINLIEQHNVNTEDIWFAVDKKERGKFINFRHTVSQKVSEYLSKNNFTKVGTDTAVPDEKLSEFFSYAKKKINEAELKYITYGHIGNSHLHVNMIPRNEQEFLSAKRIYAVLCRKAVELGGTISAEHGIGKLKRNYLLEMFGDKNIGKMIEVKKALDPDLLLGFGNMFLIENK